MVQMQELRGGVTALLIVLRKTLGELCGRLWSARPEGGQWVEKRFLVRNDLDT